MDPYAYVPQGDNSRRWKFDSLFCGTPWDARSYKGAFNTLCRWKDEPDIFSGRWCVRGNRTPSLPRITDSIRSTISKIRNKYRNTARSSNFLRTVGCVAVTFIFTSADNNSYTSCMSPSQQRNYGHGRGRGRGSGRGRGRGRSQNSHAHDSGRHNKSMSIGTSAGLKSRINSEGGGSKGSETSTTINKGTTTSKSHVEDSNKRQSDEISPSPQKPSRSTLSSTNREGQTKGRPRRKKNPEDSDRSEDSSTSGDSTKSDNEVEFIATMKKSSSDGDLNASSGESSSSLSDSPSKNTYSLETSKDRATGRASVSKVAKANSNVRRNWASAVVAAKKVVRNLDFDGDSDSDNAAPRRLRRDNHDGTSRPAHRSSRLRSRPQYQTRIQRRDQGERRRKTYAVSRDRGQSTLTDLISRRRRSDQIDAEGSQQYRRRRLRRKGTGSRNDRGVT